MKDSIKEEIGIWKEVFKAILYAWIIEISSTIARLVNGKNDIWSKLGIIGSFFIGIVFLAVFYKLRDLKNKLKEL